MHTLAGWKQQSHKHTDQVYAPLGRTVPYTHYECLLEAPHSISIWDVAVTHPKHALAVRIWIRIADRSQFQKRNSSHQFQTWINEIYKKSVLTLRPKITYLCKHRLFFHHAVCSYFLGVLIKQRSTFKCLYALADVKYMKNKFHKFDLKTKL